MVAEPGSYSAALDRSALVWTGPSLEAGNPSAFATVKRMALGGSGVEVVGDWLEPGAVPMAGPGGRVYAQERGALWRLSARREEQRKLFSGPPQLTRPRVVGDEEFMFVQRDGKTELAKRPLTRWAMIRSAAGL